jgi:hypothetical protein
MIFQSQPANTGDATQLKFQVLHVQRELRTYLFITTIFY